MRAIICAESYDLQKTLEPSFVSSMYENVKPKVWVKITGTLKGMKLEQIGDEIVATFPKKVDESFLTEIAVAETGIWHEAFEKQLSRISVAFRDILESLADAYPGVRIPTALHDLDHMLIAVLLSKRANYDMVKTWCKRLWSEYADLQALVKASRKELERIGRSYQLFEAIESIRDLSKKHGGFNPLIRELSSKPPEIARMLL